jgi:peptidoglycan/LPS O-acetylase OafA/YrhL
MSDLEGDAPRKFDSRYVDGIRGFSSLAVAIYHTMLFIGLTGTAAASLPVVFWLTRNGYQGVPIFIVLSGFVLMIAVSRAGKGKLPHGVRHYIWRRFRRIVPPYWVALVVSLGLIAAVPLMQTRAGTKWDDKLPIDWQAIVSHVFLVHDVNPNFTNKINGPMWSVSVEWQIYFLMPLLILPLWRWLGKWVAVPVVFALSLVPHFIGVQQKHHHLHFVPHFLGSLDRLHPWFIGLFAVGMLAADLLTNSKVNTRLFWVPFIVVLAWIFVFAHFAEANVWLSESLLGIATAMLVMWLAGRPRALVHRVFTSRPSLGLGKMSYSLYLVHSPLLALGNLILLQYKLPLALHATLMYVVVLPFAIAVAFGFYWGIERHFMTAHQQELRIR